MNLNLLANLNPKKMGIISVVILLLSILMIVFPIEKLVKSKMRNELVLKPGTELRSLWTAAPFPITFKVYVFNVTNPEEVVSGGKPHINEIGPFIFDEWKTKDIIEDNEKDDTVTYDMINTFIFRPDLTKSASGLTGNEIITMPHLLIMGGLIAIQRDSKPLLEMAINALTDIFKPTTPFLTARIMDILFDGIAIDCSGDSFLVKSTCIQIREKRGIKVINDTHLAFSALGGANASSIGRFTVYRGVQEIHKLGEIVTFNGEEEIDTWDDDGVCNKISGTDSTIFAPFHQKSDILYAFSPDLCRSLAAKYITHSSYHRIPTGLYSMDFGDIKNDPGQQCFCRQDDDGEVEICPPSGTLDLFRCNQAPLIASKPHFLDADEKLLRAVDGLNPKRDEHDIFLHLEMISSTPLSAAKRLQFSMDIESVPDMPIMSNLSHVVLPLFWIEESAHLNSTYTGIFRNLYLVFTIYSIIKFAGIALGCGGFILTMLAVHSAELSSKKIKSTRATSNSEQNSSEESEKY